MNGHRVKISCFISIMALMLCMVIVQLMVGTENFAAGLSNTAVSAPIVLQEQPDIWDGSVADSFSGGDGSEESPYLIANGSELKLLADLINQVNGTIYQGAAVADFSAFNSNSVYYAMTNEIHLNDTTDWENWDSEPPANEWIPIGNELYFQANFCGSNFRIFGVYLCSFVGYQGLFGYVNSASIKNIGIEQSKIIGGDYVGGIAGYFDNSKIINSYNAGDVASYLEVAYVGGIAGYVSNDSKIGNCYNLGKISGKDYVSAIAGYVNGSMLELCYNMGTILNGARTVYNLFGFQTNNSNISWCHYLYGMVANPRPYGSWGEMPFEANGKYSDGVRSVLFDIETNRMLIALNLQVFACRAQGEDYFYYESSERESELSFYAFTQENTYFSGGQLLDGIYGQTYEEILWTADGYACLLQSDNLPDGLIFDPQTSMIRGTAECTGEFSFIITARSMETLDEFSFKFRIKIAKAKVTMPTVRTDLIYNGSEQIGMNDTILYSVENGKATDAGNYTAIVTLDSNYQWEDETTIALSLPWSIAKAKVERPVKTDFVYNGSEHVSIPEAIAYTVEGGKATDAGNYTATVTLNSNYEWSNGVVDSPVILNWKIERANRSVPLPKLNSRTKSSLQLDAVQDAEYSLDGKNWQIGNIFDGLDSKTEYVVYLRLRSNPNYHDTDDIKQTTFKTLALILIQQVQFADDVYKVLALSYEIFDNYIIGQTLPVPENIPRGFQFRGWLDSAGNEVKKFDSLDNDISLTPLWSLAEFEMNILVDDNYDNGSKILWARVWPYAGVYFNGEYHGGIQYHYQWYEKGADGEWKLIEGATDERHILSTPQDGMRYRCDVTAVYGDLTAVSGSYEKTITVYKSGAWWIWIVIAVGVMLLGATVFFAIRSVKKAKYV